MLSRIETNIGDLNNPEVVEKIEELSCVQAEDIEMIARFCLANDVVIAVRTPGDRVRHLLAQGYYGKGLTIKAKTADVGPIILQGLLPVNQCFSKLIAKEDHIFAKLQEELCSKLEEDSKKLECMKDEVQKGTNYENIAHLQLIVEQPLQNERGEQLYAILNNNYYNEGEGAPRYIFGYKNNNFLRLENGDLINLQTQNADTIPITVAAYVTDIILNEREEIEVRTAPITSDYDLAVIACRSNEVNSQSPALSLGELYPEIKNFSKDEQTMLKNRGLGTVLDHVALAALVTANLSINHAPDTGNPHPEGLQEPWFAILPQYSGNHPPHCSNAGDGIIISNLPNQPSKENFFCYLESVGYNFPYNSLWIPSGYFNHNASNEGEPSLNFIVSPHINVSQVGRDSFLSYVCSKMCGLCCIK